MGVLGLGGAPALRAQTTAGASGGERVRVQLPESGDRWFEAALRPGPADSLDLRLGAIPAVIRTVPGGLRMDRWAGKDPLRGFVRGAVIGSILGAGLFAVMPDARESAYSGFFIVMGGMMGAGGGALVGTLFAPSRWELKEIGADRCGMWRLAPGSDVVVHTPERTLRGEVREHTLATLSFAAPDRSDASAISVPTHSAAIELAGPRGSRRGAAIGAVITGGIGLLGVAADPEVDGADVPLILVSNALLGGLAGYYLVPPPKHQIPLGCR